MKLLSLLFLAFIGVFNTASGQLRHQYFDGYDTSADYSIFINFGSDTTNVWQVGRPQKIIFDSAATVPNVLITDTVNSYPINDTSSFTFVIKPVWSWGIIAIRWMQKIDLDKKHDGGIIEFSTDGGGTWQNVFNNPLVYSFYGFDSANRDTLVSGQYALSGTDTQWKDIWLCFDYSYLSLYDSAVLRYTLLTDSVDSLKEGWMIDNMMANITTIHTVAKTNETIGQQLKVYPTVTNGRVYIEGEKLNQFHIIESIELIDITGRVVKKYGKCPTKYFIDIDDHPDGEYLLRIRTNLKTTIAKLILKK